MHVSSELHLSGKFVFWHVTTCRWNKGEQASLSQRNNTWTHSCTHWNPPKTKYGHHFLLQVQVFLTPPLDLIHIKTPDSFCPEADFHLLLKLEKWGGWVRASVQPERQDPGQRWTSADRLLSEELTHDDMLNSSTGLCCSTPPPPLWLYVMLCTVLRRKRRRGCQVPLTCVWFFLPQDLNWSISSETTRLCLSFCWGTPRSPNTASGRSQRPTSTWRRWGTLCTCSVPQKPV